MQKILTTIILSLSLAIPISAQASNFEDFNEFEDAPVIKKAFDDPFYHYNRLMTRFNDKLYFWAVKPAAIAYKTVVPKPARIGGVNFFKNLGFPVRFVGNLLQFKFKRAGIELSRFAINSTIGIGGLFDPARDIWKIQPKPEDFGQTLGHYGIPAGPYIVLPFFGPSNARDATGKVFDFFLNPINYVEDDLETNFLIRSVELVNEASLRLGEYEALKAASIDFYAFMHDAYEQQRTTAIKE